MAEISVIVPVYKAEAFLRKCTDSILNQTYGNLEVILVDDGSPDHCGAICDEYAAMDARVKVIHKENGGLSSARNAGMAASSGEYLSFVDGDDWLDSNVYSQCMKAAPFDVAIYGVTYVFEDSQDTRIVPAYEKAHTIRWGIDDDIIINLFRNSLFGYACNKIYSSNIIQGITFPDILIREDLILNLEVLKRATTIELVDCTGYFYLQRTSSLLHTIYSGNVPDISSIARKFIVNDSKLSSNTNQTISSILVHHYLIDSLYTYVFKNNALCNNTRLRIIKQLFSDWKLVNALKFSLSDGPLATLFYFCAKLRFSHLFFSIMKRKWYV